MWTNPYLSANLWRHAALKKGSMSGITLFGIPWVDKSSLIAMITLLAVSVVRSLISTHLE